MLRKLKKKKQKKESNRNVVIKRKRMSKSRPRTAEHSSPGGEKIVEFFIQDGVVIDLMKIESNIPEEQPKEKTPSFGFKR